MNVCRVQRNDDADRNGVLNDNQNGGQNNGQNGNQNNGGNGLSGPTSSTSGPCGRTPSPVERKQQRERRREQPGNNDNNTDNNNGNNNDGDNRGGASTGTFVSDCGRNENGHLNPDNVIVAPGVSNGAHHMHDYVGNKSTNAFSTNDSLANAGTTCANGDKSTHYWPVLRLLDGQRERDANAPAAARTRTRARSSPPAGHGQPPRQPGGQGHRDAALPADDHR
ncbi:hypothetical protein NKH77_06690 [Streptomyces sp. M19]